MVLIYLLRTLIYLHNVMIQDIVKKKKKSSMQMKLGNEKNLSIEAVGRPHEDISDS